jgi:hypothetical protein
MLWRRLRGLNFRQALAKLSPPSQGPHPRALVLLVVSCTGELTRTCTCAFSIGNPEHGLGTLQLALAALGSNQVQLPSATVVGCTSTNMVSLMPVWINPSIDDAPTYTLVSWAVFEVQLGHAAPVTRHIVGEICYGGEGKVSSPVIEFILRAHAFGLDLGVFIESEARLAWARKPSTSGTPGKPLGPASSSHATSQRKSRRRSPRHRQR